MIVFWKSSRSFGFAGCKVEIPRKEMAAHITESLADHMSLQAISHQQQLKELQADIYQGAES